MCFKEISTDMLKQQVLEGRDTNMDEEEDIRITDSREEHWRDVTEVNEKDRIQIHALRWYIHTKENK